MALVLADRIKETTTTAGTGPYTLRGAETGFEAFSTIGDTNTTYYCCTDGVDFEIGLGTFTSSGTVLARTTILQSSNSDAAFSWANGTRTIFCTQPAEKAVFLDANGNLPITNSATVGGSLGVTGSIEGSSTLAITGNATVGGTLGITGVATFTAVPLFPNNTIETADIQADAITGAKIVDNAINSEHYTDGSIDTAHIADSQITVAKMAANSIDSDQYVDASIDTAHIANLQITTGLIAADAITGAKIADDAIDSEHYTDASIDTAHIANLQITTGLIAADAVTLAKLAGIARGKFIVGDASGNPSVIGPGTNGQILTSDGTDIAFATSSAASLDDATALAIALG